MTALVPRAVRQAVGVTFPVPQPLDDGGSGHAQRLGYVRVVRVRMLADIGANQLTLFTASLWPTAVFILVLAKNVATHLAQPV